MSKNLMLFGATMLILVAGLCAWGELRPRKPSTIAQSLSVTSANNNKKGGTRLQSQLIAVRPNGFDPSEFSRPKGPFFLAVINRSRVDTLSLHLDREVGGHVKDLGTDIKTGRGAQVIDVPPGRYLLTEANHPDWICHMTITPQ
jgi:hypothetical protein